MFYSLWYKRTPHQKGPIEIYLSLSPFPTYHTPTYTHWHMEF